MARRLNQCSISSLGVCPSVCLCVCLSVRPSVRPSAAFFWPSEIAVLHGVSVTEAGPFSQSVTLPQNWPRTLVIAPQNGTRFCDTLRHPLRCWPKTTQIRPRNSITECAQRVILGFLRLVSASRAGSVNACKGPAEGRVERRATGAPRQSRSTDFGAREKQGGLLFRL